MRFAKFKPFPTERLSFLRIASKIHRRLNKQIWAISIHANTSLRRLKFLSSNTSLICSRDNRQTRSEVGGKLARKCHLGKSFAFID